MRIYEIQNIGKGVITSIIPSNLLLFQDDTLPVIEGIQQTILKDPIINNESVIQLQYGASFSVKSRVDESIISPILVLDTYRDTVSGDHVYAELGITESTGESLAKGIRVSNRSTGIEVINTHPSGIMYTNPSITGFFDESLVSKRYVDSKTTGIRPYKSYTASFTQSSTSAPVFTILENTIGTLTWARTGIGSIVASSSNLFTLNKTFITTTCGMTGLVLNATTFSANDVSLNLFQSSTGSLVDGVNNNKNFVEIKVYV